MSDSLFLNINLYVVFELSTLCNPYPHEYRNIVVDGNGLVIFTISAWFNYTAEVGKSTLTKIAT